MHRVPFFWYHLLTWMLLCALSPTYMGNINMLLDTKFHCHAQVCQNLLYWTAIWPLKSANILLLSISENHGSVKQISYHAVGVLSSLSHVWLWFSFIYIFTYILITKTQELPMQPWLLFLWNITLAYVHFRTWVEIMEKTLVHPHTNIISFLQEWSC
jgi:hypothetical protein